MDDLLREASTAAFYDALAPNYDQLACTEPGALLTRAVFQAEVARVLSPRSWIFDYGCGTGSDAAHYASLGHRVLAFDVAPRMVDALKRKCEQAIDSGQLLAWSAPAARALADWPSAAPPVVDAITANFGVFNAVAPSLLPERLAELVVRLRPGGWLFVNLNNALSLRNVLHPRRWSQAWSIARSRVVSSPDQGWATYQHSVRDLSRAVGPELRLRWSGGLCTLLDMHRCAPRFEVGGLREAIEARLWRGAPSNRLGSFLLAGFQRRV